MFIYLLIYTFLFVSAPDHPFSFTDEKFSHVPKRVEKEFEIPSALENPIDYFYRMFPANLMDLITDQTNLYITQKAGGKPKSQGSFVTKEDIMDFLSLQIKMGIIKCRNFKTFWGHDLNVPAISQVMSLNKYQHIRANIHFNDNTLFDKDNEDPYYKLRPILDSILHQMSLIPREMFYAVDEIMVPHKGKKAKYRKVYCANKPHKHGFKIYALAGQSGIIYDMIPFAGDIKKTLFGKTVPPEEEGLAVTQKYVLVLSQRVPAGSYLYFDNYFTSFEVLRRLRNEYGIYATGTIRENRIKKVDMKFQLKKVPRGTHIEKVDNKNRIALLRWADTKHVLLASNYTGAGTVGVVSRYCKVKKTRNVIDFPEMVKDYNKNMGGVDLSDQMVAFARTPFKSRRWYTSIFAHLLDICMVNAWLVFKREHLLVTGETLQMGIREFRIEVSDCLRAHNRLTIRRSLAETVKSDVIRYDKCGHF